MYHCHANYIYQLNDGMHQGLDTDHTVHLCQCVHLQDMVQLAICTMHAIVLYPCVTSRGMRHLVWWKNLIH